MLCFVTFSVTLLRLYLQFKFNTVLVRRHIERNTEFSKWPNQVLVEQSISFKQLNPDVFVRGCEQSAVSKDL